MTTPAEVIDDAFEPWVEWDADPSCARDAVLAALSSAGYAIVPKEQGPAAVIDRIASVAETVGWQAGVGGCELAGMIVSKLSASPELIDRFLTDGAGALLDGETDWWATGRLTFHAQNGDVTTPQELRIAREVKRLEKVAPLPAPPAEEE